MEGVCRFRIGEETRRVAAGDLMFIPRDTVHAPMVESGTVALLSISAPFFDRSKKNIQWSRDAFAELLVLKFRSCSIGRAVLELRRK